MTFDVESFDVVKFDEILSKGLGRGLGQRESIMCIEAAICTVLDLPHGDDPQCVAHSIRSFKIALNDSSWSSNKARAKGLRDLGLAQLGSLGVVDDIVFSKRITEETIGQLIPLLFRELYPNNSKLMQLVDICEKEKLLKSIQNLRDAAYAANAANAAALNAAAWADAAWAATYAANAANTATDAAWAAKYAAYAAAYTAKSAAAYAADAAMYAVYAASAVNAATDAADKYLILSAKIALNILKELKSPGCALLTNDDSLDIYKQLTTKDQQTK